jgi:serine/threonine protein kinase
MALASGTRLGSYEVLAQIGAGGMGEVYQAHDTKLGRDVAIKVLPEAFAHDPERLSRFQREAKMLAALNHPNIAPLPVARSTPGRILALMREYGDATRIVNIECCAHTVIRDGAIDNCCVY